MLLISLPFSQHRGRRVHRGYINQLAEAIREALGLAQRGYALPIRAAALCVDLQVALPYADSSSFRWFSASSATSVLKK